MRVVIAEDLALLREGLARLLAENGFEVVDAVEERDALVHAVLRERPEWRSSTSGFRRHSGTKGSGRRSSCAAWLPETAVLSCRSTSRGLRGGAARDGSGGIGYLLKDRIMDVDDFVDAVRRVAAGGTALDPRGRRAAARGRKAGTRSTS